MLFGENAIRRSQFAKSCLMDLLCTSSPDCISIAYMRYRRGRPDKASRCGNPVKCCSEKTLFADRSSQNHASWTCYVYYHLFAAGRPSRDGPYAGPDRGIFYELRVSRSVVVSLSLSRRNAASESEPVMHRVYTMISRGLHVASPL